MLYNMENTAMFYKDRKWTMTFAICESLYCTPVTYNIVYHLYFSLKKKKKECLQFPKLSDKCTQVGKVNGRLFFALILYEPSMPTQSHLLCDAPWRSYSSLSQTCTALPYTC